MSYCVNCGVELSNSEKSCPLCGVPVINPAKPWKATETKPYPNTVDTVVKKINLNFGILLAFIMLLIPITVSLLCDLFFTPGLSWSLIVIGGIVCFEVYLFLPLRVRRYSPYIYIITDFVVTALYLLVISLQTGGPGWYSELALPLTDAVFLFILYFTFIVRRKKLSAMLKTAFGQFGVAILCFVIDCLINYYFTGELKLLWSWIVFAVCMLFAVFFIVLHRRNAWLEELKKRLFL